MAGENDNMDDASPNQMRQMLASDYSASISAKHNQGMSKTVTYKMGGASTSKLPKIEKMEENDNAAELDS